jgi:hypothetical protein
MVLRALGADPVVVRRRQSSAVAIAEQAVAKGTGLLTPVVVSASLEPAFGASFVLGTFRGSSQ